MNDIERILYLANVWENIITFCAAWMILTGIGGIVSIVGVFFSWHFTEDRLYWAKGLTICSVLFVVAAFISTILPSRMYLYTKLSNEMSQHPEASQYTLDWVNAQLEHEVHQQKLSHIRSNVCNR